MNGRHEWLSISCRPWLIVVGMNQYGSQHGGQQSGQLTKTWLNSCAEWEFEGDNKFRFLFYFKFYTAAWTDQVVKHTRGTVFFPTYWVIPAFTSLTFVNTCSPVLICSPTFTAFHFNSWDLVARRKVAAAYAPLQNFMILRCFSAMKVLCDAFVSKIQESTMSSILLSLDLKLCERRRKTLTYTDQRQWRAC